jgi:hypothetical protein
VQGRWDEIPDDDCMRSIVGQVEKPAPLIGDNRHTLKMVDNYIVSEISTYHMDFRALMQHHLMPILI